MCGAALVIVLLVRCCSRVAHSHSRETSCLCCCVISTFFALASIVIQDLRCSGEGSSRLYQLILDAVLVRQVLGGLSPVLALPRGVGSGNLRAEAHVVVLQVCRTVHLLEGEPGCAARISAAVDLVNLKVGDINSRRGAAAWDSFGDAVCGSKFAVDSILASSSHLRRSVIGRSIDGRLE